MRPQPRAFMPGTAALIVWKDDVRLIAMILSHLSTGNSSTGATNWIPALLTSRSTPPNIRSTSAIIAAIAAPSDMSALE